MKRFLAVSMTLIILFITIMPMQIYAANGLTFSVGSIGNAARGETITIPITVSNNPGFAAVGLALTYDPEVLEIRNVSAPVAAMPLNSQFALTTTPGTQWIHLVNTNLVNWHGNGTVANITFYVKSNAVIGNSLINLTYTRSPDGTPSNANGTILSGTEVNSRNVTVEDGGFIGTPPPEENNSSGTDTMETVNPPATDGNSGFGNVPQTGVPDIAWLATAMLVSLMITAILCVYIFKGRTAYEKE